MATVFIWNNKRVRLPGSRKPKWTGHASMSIDDKWPHSLGESQIDWHVSWWGSSENVSHSGKMQAEPNDNLLRDLLAEGYAPDHIIRIPTSTNQKMAMKFQWLRMRSGTKRGRGEFRHWLLGRGDATPLQVQTTHGTFTEGMSGTGPSYDMNFKNCSVAVQRVLKAGQLEGTFSTGWYAKRPIWTPLEVKRLALSFSGAAKMTWAQIVRELLDQGAMPPDFGHQLVQFMGRQEGMGTSNTTAVHRRKGPRLSRETNRQIMIEIRALGHAHSSYATPEQRAAPLPRPPLPPPPQIPSPLNVEGPDDDPYGMFQEDDPADYDFDIDFDDFT